LTAARPLPLTGAVPTPTPLSPVAASEPEPRAKLCSFEVQSFRLFRRERLEVHPEVTVLVGVNDVGKSTLLEAIRLYGAAQRNLRRTLTGEDFQGTGDQAVRFTAEWDVGGERWKHTLVLDGTRPEERLETRDAFWIWKPRARLLQTNEGAFKVEGVSRLAALAQIDETEWKLDTDLDARIYEPLATARRFRTPPAYLFEPHALAQPTSALRTPRRNGLGWAAWLQAIINRRDSGIGELEAELRALFPHFAAVRVREIQELGERQLGFDFLLNEMASRAREKVDKAPRVPRFMVELEVTRDVQTPDGSTLRVPAERASSGLLLALAHLVLVHATPEAGLLLLEEPENGLNARITLDMIRAFLAAVRSRRQQVVLSTHNAWWLDLVAPESIRVLTRDEQGAHVHAPPKERLQALTAEHDLYPSEVVGTYGPEGLLYLEKKG